MRSLRQRLLPGRRLLAALVLIIAATLTAACSAQQSAGSPGAGTTTGSATGKPKNDLPGFGRCMRSHGIDMPDPDPNHAAQSLVQGIQDARQKYGASKVQTALTACQSYLGGMMAQKGGGQDNKLWYAYFTCLRDHGADIGDPDPQTGKPSKSDIKKLSHPDPTTKKAIDACQSSRPGAGGHK